MSVTALTSEDVKVIIRTTFAELFQVDERVPPTHLGGDFNGDGIEDIAIAVSLNRRVDRNDVSKPSFNLYMPIHTGLNPEEYKREDTLGVFAYYRDRVHLAVLHGIRDQDWLNVEPQQVHLLLGFPGIAPNKIRIYHGNLEPTTAGDERKPTPPPRLFADAILADEVFDEGIGAVTYWDGTRYREYPVNTSKK